MFIDFTNFYCQFIKNYSLLITSMTDLLKSSQKKKKTEFFQFIEKTKRAFVKLKKAFTKKFLLQHFNSIKSIRVETDASLHAAEAVLSQF